MSKYGNKFERGLEDSFRMATPGNKKKFPDYPHPKSRYDINPQKLLRGPRVKFPSIFYTQDLYSCIELEEKIAHYEIKLREILLDILKEMELEKAPKIMFSYDLGSSAGCFEYPIEGANLTPVIRICIRSIESPTSFLLNIMGVKKEHVLHGILIHELQHWKQWLSGRMIATRIGGTKWEGKTYFKWHEYTHEYPWEVEANNTVRKVISALYPDPIKLQEYREPDIKYRYWYDIPVFKNPTKIILSGI